MEKIDIEFRIDGPKLKETIPLLEVITALQEFHTIIDKSYLAKTGIYKITGKDRTNYSIVATNIRKGSFVADLQIAMFSAAQFLPNISGLSYKELWQISKNSYEFLKSLAKMRSSGIEPIINIGNNNAPIIIGNNITISNTVFNAADRSEPHFKRLTSIIKPNEVNYISCFDSDQYGFKLTIEDKDLFNPRTRLDRELFTIVGNIFKFNKESKIGKLRVFDKQSIPGGEYNFKPIIAAESIKYILSMAKQSVTINVHRELEVHTTGVERIAFLHVVSIDGFEEPGLFD